MFGVVFLFATLTVAEEDTEVDDTHDDVEEIQEEPVSLTRSEEHWIGEHRRPWWRSHRRKARKNSLSKRLKRKHRRRMRLRKNGFQFMNNGEVGEMDDFAPTDFHPDDDTTDPRHIRIRIRLRRRGPVKRDAKNAKRLRKNKKKRRKNRKNKNKNKNKGPKVGKKKKRKKNKKKRKKAKELARAEAMAMVLKHFLVGRGGDKRSSDGVVRETVQTYRRADRVAVDDGERQSVRVKVRRVKRWS